MSMTEHCWDEEHLYAMALTRISGFNAQMALQLFQLMGSATKVYENRNHIGDVVPQCSARLQKAMQQWDEPLKRSEAELKLMQAKGIQVLMFGALLQGQLQPQCQENGGGGGHTSLHGVRTRPDTPLRGRLATGVPHMRGGERTGLWRGRTCT